MSQNAMPFRLCDLPAEVRDLIYTRMISDRNSTEYRKPTIDLGIRPFFNHFAYNASVQATNHQVRREFARCLCIKHDKLVGQPVTVAVFEISINYYTDLPPHLMSINCVTLHPLCSFCARLTSRSILELNQAISSLLYRTRIASPRSNTSSRPYSRFSVYVLFASTLFFAAHA
jgi:hypothetical protein